MVTMRINSAFVANYAEFVNGRASIIGAFPAGFTIPADLPFTSSLGFVCLCDIDQADFGQTFTFDLHLVAPSGLKTQLWHFSGPLVAPPNLPRNAPMFESFICQTPVVFQMEGLHSLEFVGNGLSRTVPFAVECVR
jgi:hypothetical protein